MSKLDELIKKYCPNGVPYLCLGEVGQVKMCKRILKSQTNDTSGLVILDFKPIEPFTLNERVERFDACVVPWICFL